jgi:dihydropteroate synthase
MYLTEQPSFLNSAVEISTALSPTSLLSFLKEIEVSLGRNVSAPRNSPRPVDLDILFYNREIIDKDELQIPHIGLAEREFVLKPLLDIMDHKFIHPTLNLTIPHIYNKLKQSNTSTTNENRLDDGDDSEEAAISRVFPVQDRMFRLGDRTLILAILNMTPDSFSKDGQLCSPSAALQQAIAQNKAGADIIDIGGESTRPGAEPVSAAEEMHRVLPVIVALHRENPEILISIDTYHAETAEAAITAGAHIVNDISGGLMDEKMLPAVAKLCCPYIIMHTRGTPQTMQRPEFTNYNGNLLGEVRSELEARINAAIAAGIYRWNIIADPGIGFAKSHEQNLAILQNLEKIRPFGSFPLLVAASRKGFLAHILRSGHNSERYAARAVTTFDRDNATAAVVSSVIGQGAELVRVHNVEALSSVVKTADAIYKGWKSPAG